MNQTTLLHTEPCPACDPCPGITPEAKEEVQPIPDGVYYNLPADQYHADKAVSNSLLKKLDPPSKLKASLERPSETTTAMYIGSALHQSVLEPDLPKWWVALPKDFDARSKAGKEHLASLKGLHPFKHEEAEAIEGMAHAIRTHPDAAMCLCEGDPEVSLFATVNGVRHKARLDFVTSGTAIVDIKTCQDASPNGFGYTIRDQWYDMQAGSYLELWNLLCPFDPKTHFVFIAVEKAYPWNVAVYNLDARDIEAGQAEFHRRLDIYNQCVASNEWPGYPSGVQTLRVPRRFKVETI